MTTLIFFVIAGIMEKHWYIGMIFKGAATKLFGDIKQRRGKGYCAQTTSQQLF